MLTGVVCSQDARLFVEVLVEAVREVREVSRKPELLHQRGVSPIASKRVSPGRDSEKQESWLS